ncbi:MAG: hypothetical protein ABEJ65_06495, partial [bacterium]
SMMVTTIARSMIFIFLALILLPAPCTMLHAHELDPDRVADTTFKQDTPLQQTYERHNLKDVLIPSDSFPQNYEREIVLKLPQR